MLESIPVVIMVSTALGFLAGIGVGGGSLLILWLTMVLGMEHSVARGINLLFFLPCALISCFYRWRQGYIDWKQIAPGIIAGCIAAGIFSWIGSALEMEVLKKMFGALLIITGLRELLYKPKKKQR